jgi:hypothetical protein
VEGEVNTANLSGAVTTFPSLAIYPAIVPAASLIVGTDCSTSYDPYQTRLLSDNCFAVSGILGNVPHVYGFAVQLPSLRSCYFGKTTKQK